MNAAALAPRVGTTPSSWGVWFPDDPNQPSPEQYLREVQELGFRWSELGPWGFLGKDPAKLCDDFARHELQCSAGTIIAGLHTSSTVVDEIWPETSAIATALSRLGAENLIVVPSSLPRNKQGQVVGPRSLAPEQWKILLKNHDELGRRLWEEHGLSQVVHVHADTFVATWGEVARLLDGTDVRYTNLCLDVGHFSYYLGDSFSLLMEYPDRVGYLQLKQIEPTLLAEVLKNDLSYEMAVREGVMCDLGEGLPDLSVIIDAAARVRPDIFAVIDLAMFPLYSPDQARPIVASALHYIKNLGVDLTLR